MKKKKAVKRASPPAKPATKTKQPVAKKKRPTADDFAEDDEPKKRGYFKPGNNANPRGAAAHNQLAKQIKHLTKKELQSLANLVLQGNVYEIRRIKKDKAHSSTLKVMLASIAIRVIEKGDHQAMEALLNRMIGKVPEKFEHEGLNGTGPQIIVTVPSNGREAKTT